MPVCIKCSKDLPVSEFYFRSDQNVLRRECKSCWNAQRAVHYAANKEQHARVVKARYDNFGRFARYGITKEQYEALLAAQGYRCALCGTDKPGGKGLWHIDHAHAVGEPKIRRTFAVSPGGYVRGLLCHTCNIALGHSQALFERVPKERVDAYIRQFKD